MHRGRHQHGHAVNLRGWHAAVAIGLKLALVAGALAILPAWSGWVTWTVGIHAALAAVLLVLGGIALFRHRISIRGSAHGHDHGASGVTIHGAAAYDLLAKAMTLGREGRLRRAMLATAELKPGEALLDVACGTGTLAIAASRQVGATGEVIGIDAAPEMLARAAQKAARSGSTATFTHGTAQSLPFPGERFDVVTGTLMLHHIPPAARVAFAGEARRVLKPGGRIVLVDFGSPEGASRLFGLHSHGGVDPRDMARILGDAGFREPRIAQLGMMGLYSITATT
jgi:ubiquinone/menaquinone biosynthesis C-methylase UbiE